MSLAISTMVFSEIIFGPTKFLVPKNYLSQKFFVNTDFVPKIFGSKIFQVQMKIDVKKVLLNFFPNIILLLRI